MCWHKKNTNSVWLALTLLVFCGSFSLTAWATDYSGTYICYIQGDENTTEYTRIEQTDSSAVVYLSWDCPSPGVVDGNVMTVTLDTAGTIVLTFSEDGQDFSGTWEYYDMTGTVTGTKVDDSEWVQHCYDIDTNGIPRLTGTDFTELHKISKISKLRSGEGHDYSDCFESCRSMKHYYVPFDAYRENNNIEIYCPINGIIEHIGDEGSGLSIGLTNKQIRIRSAEEPAFIFVIFHTDLISPDVNEGVSVHAGQLLGHARMYHPDVNEYSHSFDIAIWVNTPSGMKYVSYFETMNTAVFDQYIARGARSRYDFIINQTERDADPLTCDGEEFLGAGNLENWMTLGSTNGCDFCGHNFSPPDGVVNTWDLSFLVNRWLQTGCDALNWCDGTDFDHNTSVDFIDFGTFARHWLWE